MTWSTMMRANFWAMTVMRRYKGFTIRGAVAAKDSWETDMHAAINTVTLLFLLDFGVG